MMDMVVEKYLAKHKPKDTHSTIEMWKLREQAKQLAEEVIYGDIDLFAIVEVKDGKGCNKGWGRLKSRVGWISLVITRRCN